MAPEHPEDERHIMLQRHDYKLESAALLEELFQLPTPLGMSYTFHIQKQKEQQRFSPFLQTQLI